MMGVGRRLRSGVQRYLGTQGNSDPKLEAAVTELSGRLDVVAAAVSSLSGPGGLAAQIESLSNQLSQQGRFSTERGDTVQVDLGNILQSTRDILKRVSTITTDSGDPRVRLLHWRAAAARQEPRDLSMAPVVPPKPRPLAEVLAGLERRAPANFRTWERLFDVAAEEYKKRDESSLSNASHQDAFLFREFLAIYGQGRLLDIGVGPLATPSYLADFRRDRLAGIDPLPPYDPHPFAFAQSVSESIPWDDASFDTVISATSLDHIFLLDVAMDEVCRVLAKGGRFVIWLSMFRETPPYDPYGGPLEAYDAYHLFHPGRNWFPSFMERWFKLLECMEIRPDNFLMSFEKRE